MNLDAMMFPGATEVAWLLLLVFFIFIAWVLIGYPRWKVWAAHQSGLADLARANNEQQIQIAQATSRLKAADLNKQAAIIEAQAVACQIEAIGTKLTTHDLYLKWQWIKMMEERPESSTIYVATEASLPILEATRRIAIHDPAPKEEESK